MFPGDMPHLRPELTKLEEMLIARVYVFYRSKSDGDQQYKYKGHVAIRLLAKYAQNILLVAHFGD